MCTLTNNQPHRLDTWWGKKALTRHTRHSAFGWRAPCALATFSHLLPPSLWMVLGDYKAKWQQRAIFLSNGLIVRLALKQHITWRLRGPKEKQEGVDQNRWWMMMDDEWWWNMNDGWLTINEVYNWCNWFTHVSMAFFMSNVNPYLSMSPIQMTEKLLFHIQALLYT